MNTLYRSWGSFEYTVVPNSAFQAGDVADINAPSPILNYPVYDQVTESLSPFVLNGLQVKILSIDNTTGVATIEVNFDEFSVREDTRWTGNIEVPDITENSDADLVLDTDKDITLDVSKTINRASISPETGDFINPSVLTIKSGAKLHMKEKTNLIVKNGSKLIIEEGAEVLLDNHACIVVEETGILEIKDNNIRLNGEKAAISIRGTLKTNDNTNFTFAGNGYVEFYPNHTLEMGSNSDFILTRESGDEGTLFLLLHDGTTLAISDRKVELRDGRVEYINDAGVELVNVNFEGWNTDFVGEWSNQNSPVGISSVNATQFDLRFSEFHTFETAIELSGNTTIPVLSNNTFSLGNEGVVGSNMDHIILTNNYFHNFRQNSIRMEQVDYVGIQQNVIDHLLTNREGNGCHFKNVNFASLYLSTYIQNCDNGVLAEQSNVFVNNGSTISGNNIGVHFVNNATAEWLLSVGKCKCAYIIDNDVGVAGDNVVLDIDVYEHQFECNSDLPSPNRFDGNLEIFDICYNDSDFPFDNTVLARGNFWGGQSLNTYSYRLQNGPASYNCVTNGYQLSVDDSDFITDINNVPSCGFIEGPYPPTPQYPEEEKAKIECEVIEGSSTILVHEQSRAAYEELYQKNYAAATSDYAPVANLDHSNTTDICVNKINIARCLVKAIDNDQYASPNADWNQNAVKIETPLGRRLLIYPNPIHGRDHLQLRSQTNERLRIRIVSLLGQLVLEQTLFDHTVIDTEKWLEGIYWIEVRNESGKWLQTDKILVQ